MYRGERNVKRVLGSVTGIQNKSVTGQWKNEWEQKYNGGMSSRLWCILGRMIVYIYDCIYILNGLRLVHKHFPETSK